MNMNFDRELAWDDKIVKDSDYILLPEGDYDFRIITFERARHEPKPGSPSKLPACNKAIVKIAIVDPATGQDVEINHNLFLHTITEGMLSAFFAGIGLKKKGEPAQMSWQQVPGRTGRCKVGIKTYNGNDYNEIKKFYPKEDMMQQGQPMYQQPVQQTQATYQQPVYQQQQNQNNGNNGGFTPGQF